MNLDSFKKDHFLKKIEQSPYNTMKYLTKGCKIIEVLKRNSNTSSYYCTAKFTTDPDAWLAEFDIITVLADSEVFIYVDVSCPEIYFVNPEDIITLAEAYESVVSDLFSSCYTMATGGFSSTVKADYTDYTGDYYYYRKNINSIDKSFDILNSPFSKSYYDADTPILPDNQGHFNKKATLDLN